MLQYETEIIGGLIVTVSSVDAKFRLGYFNRLVMNEMQGSLNLFLFNKSLK